MTDEQIEAVLGDFRRWLREHGDEEPAFDPVALVEEFTALRHEVKLLTKAVGARNEDGESAPADDLRPLVTAAIEMVDAVDRGVEAASRLAAGRGGWRRLFRGGKQVAALAEGLKLA